MVRRRTGKKAGPPWPLIAGLAAVAAAVAAFLASRRRTSHPRPTGPVDDTPTRALEVVPTRPVPTREGRVVPMARNRTQRKAGFNWPLLLGIIVTLALLWLWWWAATQGGPS